MAACAAFVLGLSKAGFKGLGFLVVTLLALAYEAKSSTGILLPIINMADFFAIYYYRNDVRWKTIKQLLPWMMIGVIVGVFVGDAISLIVFKKLMAGIILISAIMMIIFDRIKSEQIPDNAVFSITMGMGAGFATMIGNLAGAFANLYFLALRFPKKKFIGTAAYLFFFINVFKLPFHIWVWHTISWRSISETIFLYPITIIGFYVGLKLIKYLSNDQFKKYIIAITIIGAIIIFIK